MNTYLPYKVNFKKFRNFFNTPKSTVFIHQKTEMSKAFTPFVNKSNNFILISASALGLYVFTAIVSTTKTEYLRRNERDESTSITKKERNKKCKANVDNIIYCIKNTERNKRVLKGANDLLKKPWGFENCHFSSVLATMRPSPFRFGTERALLVRRRVSACIE